ncbi:SGNH/GDSL hydrolase family protein [Mucilaginibacter sabulilitoris]|uniref:SGNH/GDSL hydrolase family protein n=1 Tax=Mucilaginibacter sabulilitoris TaxID=1173583 RepID=A0ABZ0TF35_9SPHI|nr:SGNH/GDSL hydrolase family protein [Mucilaginibacter sabulilitoris]WPU91785.1 SGNH/GDSL hydrolase family protein [Mucilaginibacter sabulilitoris]
MAKTQKFDDLPPITNLTGAKIVGLTAGGEDAQFPLDNIVRNSIGSFKTTDTAPIGPLLNQSVELIGTGVGSSPSGTYTNLHGVSGTGIVIPSPSLGNVIINAKGTWNGTYWIPSYQEITLPVNNNKIVPWVAGTYSLGEQVNYLGKDWVANSAAISTDVPGTSTKWSERLVAYLGTDKVVYTTDTVYANDQLFNLADYLHDTSVSSTGAIAVYPAASTSLNARTMKLHVDPIKGNIKLTGFQHLGTAAYRWAFYDVSNTLLTFGNINTESASAIAIPATAYWFYCLYRHPTIDTDTPTDAGANLMVNYGTTAKPWVAYVAPTINKNLVSVNDAKVKAVTDADLVNYALKTYVQGFMKYYGMKLVTIGDSITNNSVYQPILVGLTGMVWSITETQAGTGGHARMGLGGSTIVPKVVSDGAGGYVTGQGPGMSIYVRSLDAHYYNPDVILIMGGQNDGRTGLGTIDDPEYTGGELASTDPSLPTFASAYKGLLKQLITANPTTKIIGITPYYTGTSDYTSSIYTEFKNRNDLIKSIFQHYSIECIDQISDLGFHPLNNTTNTVDGIHPTTPAGATKMAKLYATRLK